MKIAVIGAMEQEVEHLREALTEPTTDTIANSEFTSGHYGGHELILVKSGIGKVNAAMTTSILLEKYRPDVVINTGSAGGYDPSLKVGDIVVSTEVRHHDVDVRAFGYEMGQVPGMPAAFAADALLIEKAQEAIQAVGLNAATGLIATGDSFMHIPQRVQETREHFPTMAACEMEAAAVAQVCHQFETPFVVIRALSDIAGQESPMSFDEFLPTAAKNSTQVVLHVVNSL
ncbi:5'-methylthioadenosine/S-adenosylhomocysteine nucleosidase [Chryseomicrobium sp. FSL W7-1435]|uniref:5'-methylthioadenosine/S-adenosylhomocysteine nucleosidase n=1 Tax=Chryseomicrobium sp. FSL W7-1435 TaxID=2921704 RepID=UPI00315AE8CE